MPTCAVYARVSTDKQGESLENQVTLAEEYIRRLGPDYELNPECVYTDFDQSGYYTRFVSRPAIRHALTDAQAGKYQVIVFKEISRISRDQAEHIEIVSRFTQCGVRVIAMNDNLDSDRPETLDLLGIHSVMSEMESKRISSRVSTGKKALARRGCWVGEAPIGYRVNPEARSLVVDEEFAHIPQLIFRWFTDERMGTFKIAEQLNQRGLFTKRGGLWSRVTVSRVLKNPAYAGDLVYGRTRNTLKRVFDETGYTKSLRKQPVRTTEWVVLQGTHDALVSRATFNTAQDLLAERGRKNPRRTTHPLTGLLKCARCGCGMICQSQRAAKKTYRYYTCSRAFRFGRQACSQPNLPADRLEQSVFEYLLQHLPIDDGLVLQLSPKSAESWVESCFEQLKAESNKLELALQRLYMDTDLTESLRLRVRDGLVTQLQAIETKRRELESAASSSSTNKCPQQIAASKWLAELSLQRCFRDLSAARRWFHQLLNAVIVDGWQVQTIEIKYAPAGYTNPLR